MLLAEILHSNGYAVGWIALALINAGIAQGKDRKGANWFVVSVLLGPLATFLLVALEKGKLSPAAAIK